MFYPNWFSRGIVYPVDILKSAGNIKTKEEIEAVFNLKINFLDYYRLKCFLKSYLNQFNIQEFKCVKPIYPSIFKILKTQNGCKTFYQRLNKDRIFPEKRLKLAQKLSLLITDNKWCMSNQICFRTIQITLLNGFTTSLSMEY